MLTKAACLAQATQRRYDQAIVQGAKEGVHAQHEKAAASGGGGIDTQGAEQAVGEGMGQARQAADKVAPMPITLLWCTKSAAPVCI